MAEKKYQVEERFQKSEFHIRGNNVSSGFRKLKAADLTDADMDKLYKGKHPGIKLKSAGGPAAGK